MKLTTEQEAWLQALESDKYKQGQGVLHRGNEFCCLGVACDLLKDELTINQVASLTRYNGEYQVLPALVVEKLHLRDNCGLFALSIERINTSFEGETIICASLTELNDSGGYTFKEIAAYIRANPENVFTKGAD